jgi:hypothetical protein
LKGRGSCPRFGDGQGGLHALHLFPYLWKKHGRR